MVGGFVEEQDIGVGKEEFGQLDAHQPATAETTERAVARFFFEAQTCKHRGHPRFAFVSAAVGKVRTHLVVAFGQRARHFFVCVSEARHLMFEVAHFGFEVVEAGEGLGGFFLHRVLLVRVDLLAEHANADAARPLNITAIHRLVAGHHL